MTEILEPGERWRLYEGDSLLILRDLPTASVSATITDPPYSSGGLHAGARKATPEQKYSQRIVAMPHFGGDNKDQHSFMLWCYTWLAECLRITRPGGVGGIFCDWRQIAVASDALQMGGWIWRGIVPWDKQSARPYLGRFTNQCEFFVWGSNGEMGDLNDPRANSLGVLPGVVREHSVSPQKRNHMTEKPEGVMRMLSRCVLPGEVVLDPFAGSGSTLVGALLEGRRAIGIEQSPEYAEIARTRCTAAAAQAPMLTPKTDPGTQVGMFGG